MRKVYLAFSLLLAVLLFVSCSSMMRSEIVYDSSVPLRPEEKVEEVPYMDIPLWAIGFWQGTYLENGETVYAEFGITRNNIRLCSQVGSQYLYYDYGSTADSIKRQNVKGDVQYTLTYQNSQIVITLGETVDGLFYSATETTNGEITSQYTCKLRPDWGHYTEKYLHHLKVHGTELTFANGRYIEDESFYLEDLGIAEAFATLTGLDPKDYVMDVSAVIAENNVFSSWVVIGKEENDEVLLAFDGAKAIDLETDTLLPLPGHETNYTIDKETYNALEKVIVRALVESSYGEPCQDIIHSYLQDEALTIILTEWSYEDTYPFFFLGGERMIEPWCYAHACGSFVPMEGNYSPDIAEEHFYMSWGATDIRYVYGKEEADIYKALGSQLVKDYNL